MIWTRSKLARNRKSKMLSLAVNLTRMILMTPSSKLKKVQRRVLKWRSPKSPVKRLTK